MVGVTSYNELSGPEIAPAQDVPDVTPQPVESRSQTFDFGGAERANIPKAQVVEFLAPKVNFNLSGARQAGLSDDQIYNEFRNRFSAPEPAKGPGFAGFGQAARETAQNIYGLGRGAITGTLALPGEVERLARMAQPYLPYGYFGSSPFSSPAQQPREGRETILPITEEVSAALPLPAATGERAGGFERIGEVIGIPAFPDVTRAARQAASATGRGIARIPAETSLVGRPSIEQAAIASEAERAGMTVAPRQVRAGEPGETALRPSDQRLINREATRAAGLEADAVTDAWVAQSAENFNSQYRRLYGANVDINENAANALRNIIRQEGVVWPAGETEITSTARNLLRRFEIEEARVREQEIMRLLGQQRSSMKRSGETYIERRFAPNERIDAPELSQAILNELGVGKIQNLRPIMANDAPAWAPEVNRTIQELVENLGLRVRPKVYIGTGQGSYGWASPTGHIFLNESLLVDGRAALSTALHEFGHQAEFQLFFHAPSDVKKSIADAWQKQRQNFQGATIEQLRPLTAEKYDEAVRQYIPTSSKDVRYYHGFNEWFAEQVSRWLTQTKEPVTLAEKFFKNIGDMWRFIYARVTGYQPQAQEVADFMKANWNGKLINQEGVYRIYNPPEARTGTATRAAPTPTAPSEPIIAQIPGEELRRLRSNIADFAARTQDGNAAYSAKNLVREIDAAIEATNPRRARELKRVNEQYGAFMDLREMRRVNAGDINRSGYVSPAAVANLLQRQEAGFENPLNRIRELGAKLGYVSRSEGAGATRDPTGKLLSRDERRLAAVLRQFAYPLERASRFAQRRMTPEYAPPRPGLPPVSPTTRAATTGLGVQRAAEEAQNAVEER